MAGVMAAPPPPLQVMVDTWYVVENWVSEDCMRRKSGVEVRRGVHVGPWRSAAGRGLEAPHTTTVSWLQH